MAGKGTHALPRAQGPVECLTPAYVPTPNMPIVSCRGRRISFRIHPAPRAPQYCRLLSHPALSRNQLCIQLSRSRL